MKILMITHELSNTGAPVAMFNVAKVLKENIYPEAEFDILSFNEGPLRTDFEKMGMKVGINIEVRENMEAVIALAGKYDFIFLNTLDCVFAAFLLGKLGEKVYWWIHENYPNFMRVKEILAALKLEKSVHVLSTGPYVDRMIDLFISDSLPTKMLELYIQDVGRTVSDQHEKVRFVYVGRMVALKGIDILVNAMMKLAPEVTKNCEFIFVGSDDKGIGEIRTILEKINGIYGNIKIMGQLAQSEIMQVYDLCDVVVVPSRDESMSMAAVEGFMKEKLVIASSGCGIAQYVTNEVEGFIFENQNSDELALMMTEAVRLCMEKQQQDLCAAGRKLYEKHFSYEHFVKNIGEVLI